MQTSYFLPFQKESGIRICLYVAGLACVVFSCYETVPALSRLIVAPAPDAFGGLLSVHCSGRSDSDGAFGTRRSDGTEDNLRLHIWYGYM